MIGIALNVSNFEWTWIIQTVLNFLLNFTQVLIHHQSSYIHAATMPSKNVQQFNCYKRPFLGKACIWKMDC